MSMNADQRRRQLGDSNAPGEDEIAESYDRVVAEGAGRLARSWTIILITGTFGGFEVGVGLLAYLAVMHATQSHLLAGLAFGIGLVALLLAKSELFTEGFLFPITAFAAKQASFASLLKLWSGTLVMNLVGAGFSCGWWHVLSPNSGPNSTRRPATSSMPDSGGNRCVWPFSAGAPLLS